MKQTGTKSFALIMTFLVIIGLGVYTYINDRSANRQGSSEQTEKDILFNYDFTENYPKTARETVKLHCRYLKSLYNEEWAEDELYTANKQIRHLFDDELLSYNTEDAQLTSLKSELKLYKENKQKIINYSLSESSQIEYNTEGDTEYAKMKVILGLKVGTSSGNVEEEYILRKNKDGEWKILGWQKVQDDTTEGEGE